MIGGDTPADIRSLTERGYEISDCGFSIKQVIDDKEKMTTKACFGAIEITLSRLPSNEIIEWAFNSEKYYDGAVITLDAENVLLEKVIFQNAACTNFHMNYERQGDIHMLTEISLRAQKVIVGDGIVFDNEWAISNL
jgi:hypothetical protein